MTLKNTCLLILMSAYLLACQNKANQEQTTSLKDSSVVIKNLTSDVNWEEEKETKLAKQATNKTKTTTNPTSGARGGAADNDLDVQKYRNFRRSGNKAADFAQAIIYPAIRMVYSDNFAQPKANVLSSTKKNDRLSVEISIQWKDHWVPSFEMKGLLEVNIDGSNAVFTISSKNTYVESLEFTEDSFKNSLTIKAL